MIESRHILYIGIFIILMGYFIQIVTLTMFPGAWFQLVGLIIMGVAIYRVKYR